MFLYLNPRIIFLVLKSDNVNCKNYTRERSYRIVFSARANRIEEISVLSLGHCIRYEKCLFAIYMLATVRESVRHVLYSVGILASQITSFLHVTIF